VDPKSSAYNGRVFRERRNWSAYAGLAYMAGRYSNIRTLVGNWIAAIRQRAPAMRTLDQRRRTIETLRTKIVGSLDNNVFCDEDYVERYLHAPHQHALDALDKEGVQRKRDNLNADRRLREGYMEWGHDQMRTRDERVERAVA